MTGSSVTALLQSAGRCLVLTPNAAVARLLRRELLRDSNRRVMPTPPIVPLDHWLQEMAERIWRTRLDNDPDTPRIATAEQELLLWSQAIAAHAASTTQLPAIAEEARRVFRLMRERGLDERDLPAGEVPYRAWLGAFKQRMAELGLTTAIDLLLAQRHNVTKHIESRFDAVHLAGFSADLPAAIRDLLHCDAVTPAAHDLPHGPPGGRLAPLPSPRLELRRAIRWAAAVHRGDPTTRIAVVVPRLDQMRLAAEYELETAFDGHPVYAILPAKPLTENLLVRTAFDLLALNRDELDVEQCSRLLNRSGWANETDLAHPGWRSEADTLLRSLAALRLPADRFRELVGDAIARLATDREQPATTMPGTSAAREALREATRNGDLLAPSRWAELFQQQLDQFGWPSQSGSSEPDDELVASWLDALRRLSALNPLLPSCALTDALDLLQQICASRPGPAGPAAAPVTVVESVESTAGCSHVWVLGAHHLEWPQPPRPSPLLPIRFQIEHDFPRVVAERELELARHLLEQLRGSGADVVFSYAERDGDQELVASPLLAGLPTVDAGDLPGSETATETPVALERVDCSTAPPLAESERASTRGGARLLQSFAACPFTAFAVHRLGIEPFPTPSLGFSMLDRGVLSHRALELIGSGYGSSGRLATLSARQRNEMCREAARESVRRFVSRMHNAPPAYVASLEVERLTGLLERWLEREAQRAPFEIVAVEQPLELQLGPLHLRLRMDRIDRCGDSLLVIDYKTGALLSAGMWLADPPEEPQLPLYAIASDAAVDAIAIGQFNAANQRLLGLQRSGAGIDAGLDERDDWDTLLLQWRDSLTGLAQRYASGACEVGDHSVAARYGDPYAGAHRWAELRENPELGA